MANDPEAVQLLEHFYHCPLGRPLTELLVEFGTGGGNGRFPPRSLSSVSGGIKQGASQAIAGIKVTQSLDRRWYSRGEREARPKRGSGRNHWGHPFS
jgi:hypothetical protein